MIIQEENKLRLAAENSSTLNSADLKDKTTALDEVKAQQEQYETENKELEKQLGKWKRNNIIALIVLIIVLLFSLTTVMVVTKYKLNKYEVILKSNEIVVKKEDISSMTTNELREATKNKYVANCMEFYYDMEEDKYYDVSGNTTYYSVSSLRNAVFGNPITYSVESVDKVNKPKHTSDTAISSYTFSYGLLDGSAQMAIDNSEKLVFSGYSKALLDSYMNADIIKEPKIVSQKPAYIVINKKIEVTKDLIDSVFVGIEDYYMANSDRTEKLDEVTYDDYWYGYYVENNRLYYLTSHDCNVGKDSIRQALNAIDVTDLVENNLENYLSEDIELTFKVPTIVNQGTTVIYINTINTVKDPFQIAYEQGIY